MESNKKLVNVRIFGQEYPIRASSNEEYIALWKIVDWSVPLWRIPWSILKLLCRLSRSNLLISEFSPNIESFICLMNTSLISLDDLPI